MNKEKLFPALLNGPNGRVLSNIYIFFAVEHNYSKTEKSGLYLEPTEP